MPQRLASSATASCACFIGTHKQYSPALGGELFNKLVRLVQARHRLLQVDDMDAVAIHKDKRRHLGIPATGLVPEMYAGLKKLLH